jgi:ABC-type bacteriocin/lantibiotic exporter with double-glycine peptidase domain
MRPAVVRQSGDNDCGLAALATVAAHHGVPVDYQALAGQVLLDPDGTDLLTLSRLAARLGFRARGVKASYDAIGSCPLPAIVQLRRRGSGDGHFVVLHRWTSHSVVIADPAKGLRTCSRKSFCRRLTGYLLLLQPPADDRAPVAATAFPRP